MTLIALCLKFIRKANQRRKLDNRGWACLGRIMSNDPRSEFYVKRGNWIYNVCRGNGAFKGTV